MEHYTALSKVCKDWGESNIRKCCKAGHIRGTRKKTLGDANHIEVNKKKK